MPHRIRLASDYDFAGWRTAARQLAMAAVSPEDVVWSVGAQQDLFGDEAADLQPANGGSTFNVPRRFLELAQTAFAHKDHERFALLYRLLWRLRTERDLLDLMVDPDVARINAMAKNVRRDIHKMHAFVRFRAVEKDGGEHFIAWFEPEHHSVELGTPFFARRFSNMRWSILTPEASAHWDLETLAFGPGAGRHDAPDDDALEEIWRGYYASIFNPARLKVDAMRSEMPQKYWRNLPEAPLIAPLIADARRRTQQMVDEAVSTPKPNPQRPIAARVTPAIDHNDPLAAVRAAALGCRDCPLWEPATQTVFGEGPPDAPIVFVGEQPGDKEDLAGRPFVGPAGQLFDRALAEAGIDRTKTYVTNAVKHFKFTPRGKIRLHQKPATPEIRACHQWLERELEIIRPRLVVALGATAVQSVFDRAMPIGKLRGTLIDLEGGVQALVTVHPSFLLRVPDEARKAQEYANFIEDLRLAREVLLAA